MLEVKGKLIHGQENQLPPYKNFIDSLKKSQAEEFGDGVILYGLSICLPR
jgi:hypothetical protein